MDEEFVESKREALFAPGPGQGMPESTRRTLLENAAAAMRDHIPQVARAKLEKLLEYG